MDRKYFDYTDYSMEENKTSESPPPKKNKKNRLALLLAVNMLFSAAVGFGGGMAAWQFIKPSEEVTLTVAEDPAPQMIQTAKIGDASLSVSDIAALAANSVVEITTETVTNGSRLQQYVSKGAGSGVIISGDGYIVTNNHVIDGARKITVRLRSGETYPATLVGTDAKTDVAVVKIEASGLQAAVFGNSDNLVVGETAVAIGNPLGELGGTVTDGIISALDREIEIDGQPMRLLQTNAAINPGNSGGGLFNARAELIGIVNAKSSGSDVEGLGFAIPANTAKKIAEQLIEHGYVTGRAKLGVSVIEADETIAAMYGLPKAGLYVQQVESGSGADKGGVKSGDYLISVNGKKLTAMADLSDLLASLSPGKAVTVVVSRDNKEIALTVTLSEAKN